MQMKEKKEKRIIIYKFPTPKRKKKKPCKWNGRNNKQMEGNEKKLFVF